MAEANYIHGEDFIENVVDNSVIAHLDAPTIAAF